MNAVFYPEAVLFDCDGVLADSEHLVNRLISEELSRRGWIMTPAQARSRFLGLTLPAMVPIIEKHLRDSLPKDWAKWFKNEVAELMAQEVQPIPGAETALQTIRAAGLPMALASNSSGAELGIKLDRLGLRDFFGERTFCFEDVAHSKPHPDMYLAAAFACGASSSKCLVVEDSPLGTQAGHAAGCFVLGFCRETDSRDLVAAGASAIFNSMADLPSLIGIIDLYEDF